MFRFQVFVLLMAMTSVGWGQLEAPPLRGAIDLDVVVETRPVDEIDADVVVIPVFDGEDVLAGPLEGTSGSLSSSVSAAISQKAMTGSLFRSVSFFGPEGLACSRLLLIGAGEEADLDGERVRRLAGVAVRQVRKDEVASMAFVVRGGLLPAEAAMAVTEGAILGAFDSGIHKSDNKRVALVNLSIAGLSAVSAGVEAAIDKAGLTARATNFARSLVVEPANYVTPEVMAAHARAIARETGLEVQVFDDKKMEEMGMGGVLAVGKGSVNRPRFIVLSYKSPEPSDVTLAFVGKGVCFDTGGISIKGRQGMYRMKGDMAGGATVLAVMKILGRLKPKVNVLGIVPAVENMPGPYAQKPGDVFTGYSGKTVEVMSTDAEGRLILSDGISYAVARGATHLVDIATLTGTVRRALGDRHVGTFASDDEFFDILQDASKRTGESFWRLPIDEEYARGIKSSLVADLNETGGIVGASVGAKFIQQFTEGKPWIHLDIAGTSWPDHTPAYRGSGPTGVTVRTLAELAMMVDGNASPTSQ
jgi:leucyl aminopeptidase